MSIKLISVSFLGLLFGFVGMQYFSKSPSQKKRLPPSVKVEKHLSMLKSAIVVVEESGDTTTLKGRIQLRQATPNPLTYDWLLPEGVEVVEGSISDQIVNPVVGLEQNVFITVRGFNSSEKKAITLLSQMTLNSARFGSSASVSNQPENIPERQIAEQYNSEK